MSILIYTVVSLCVLGVILAVVLYFVAQKFQVHEDPRIEQVEGVLPGANCGACGFPGCRGMAEALVSRDDISELYCPVGGAATMSAASTLLGKAAAEREPEVAVVRCGGCLVPRGDGSVVRARLNVFDGARSCAVEAATYAGDTGCSFGCLGNGDCVAVCAFDAIRMDPATGLPTVDDEKCTACGKCVKACPKLIIELRRKGPKSRRVFVSCVNKDKGGVARKACEVACIGCGKCVKVCAFEAITVESNLAYIDPAKCKLCRKCVAECPTGAIVETNFPPRKPAEPSVEKPAETTEQ
ncbi:MAG: Fe-S cluster domain-containing protein [Alistipes sp.]|jgi:Na+-translocating ferredoxin:NAD+ oxidoreductase RNF subunit RnfB|nr:Fe-S cluster domain-containing protein [Alistipes sp.]